ncbi:MAG: ATP-binding cassette domain-containing protein, partial [Mycobacteriaceae bacterium]
MSDTDNKNSAAPEAKTAVSGVEIVLEDVVKRFPGSKEPAVDHVSLTIPAGEVVVFVGPSGCGKTTTMRMINRLIEPTSGRITIGGKDALSLNADQLRRGIGYSIQAAGLFP